MSTVAFRASVRDQSARILWGDAETLDHLADAIGGMTVDEAQAYIRELAVAYRQASSDAARGRATVTVLS